MRATLLVLAALFAVTVASSGKANAGGCGPGCHVASWGGCIPDGWGVTPVRNECPVGSAPRPRCPYGYVWRPRLGACFGLN